MFTEPNAKLVKEILLQRKNKKSFAEILRYLAKKGLSPIEMCIQFAEALNLDFTDVSCINGWWCDGTSELSDEQINHLLEHAIKQNKLKTLPQNALIEVF